MDSKEFDENIKLEIKKYVDSLDLANVVNKRVYKFTKINVCGIDLYVHVDVYEPRNYRNQVAKKKGFKDYNEYDRQRRHKKGICSPLKESENCGIYLGVYVAENVLSKVFENVKRMPAQNRYYDFICGKGYKIDVKSSCIRIDRKGAEMWEFSIRHNNIADYFLMVAYDDRKKLNPLHLWLIKGNEIIGVDKRKTLNAKDKISICNTVRSLKVYEKYEVIDKLDKVKESCTKFKNSKKKGK